jgi:hypothetical protein
MQRTKSDSACVAASAVGTREQRELVPTAHAFGR